MNKNADGGEWNTNNKLESAAGCTVNLCRERWSNYSPSTTCVATLDRWTVEEYCAWLAFWPPADLPKPPTHIIIMLQVYCLLPPRPQKSVWSKCHPTCTWLPVAKNHNFGQILTFGGSCTGSLLPIRVKFGVLKQTGRLHLRAKFHLKVFIVSASSGQNPQFWANFDFWGLLYRPPIIVLPMKVKFGVLLQTERFAILVQYRLVADKK